MWWREAWTGGGSPQVVHLHPEISWIYPSRNAVSPCLSDVQTGQLVSHASDRLVLSSPRCQQWALLHCSLSSPLTIDGGVVPTLDLFVTMGAWDYDFECGTCGKSFPAGWQARDQHYCALGHEPPEFECDTCPRILRDDNAKFQHMLARNHFANECRVDDCDETWPTVEQRIRHEHNAHLYCDDCDRFFRSAHNLKQVSRRGSKSGPRVDVNVKVGQGARSSGDVQDVCRMVHKHIGGPSKSWPGEPVHSYHNRTDTSTSTPALTAATPSRARSASTAS